MKSDFKNIVINRRTSELARVLTPFQAEEEKMKRTTAAVISISAVFFALGMLVGAAIMRPPNFDWLTSSRDTIPTRTYGSPILSGGATVTPIPRWWEVLGPKGIQDRIDGYVTTGQRIYPGEIDGFFSVHQDLQGYFDQAYIIREIEQGKLEPMILQTKRGNTLTNYWSFDVKNLQPANYQIVVELRAFGTTLVKKGEWFSVP